MGEIILSLNAGAPHPKAGDDVEIFVELAENAEQDLIVSFEKHRIFVDASGKHSLCVIESGYFTEHGIPTPVQILKGSKTGSTSLTVDSKAKNPPCPNNANSGASSVKFPDWLLLTAFVRSKGDANILGKEHLAITIHSSLERSK